MNRIRPYREFLALWVGLVGLAIPAGAVTNGTTVVSFAVKCTDIACEYIVTFTGDDNANNSFLIQYRKTGASTFLNAYKPYIDRRARVNGTANPYYRTARGSVLIGTGLDNTSFDFQATASDADGVAGTNPITPADSSTPTVCSGGACFTYNLNPTLAAGTCNVSVDADIATAIAASCGHVVIASNATLGRTIWTRAGTANNWVEVDCQPGATIQSPSVAVDMFMNVAFTILQGCTFPSSVTSAFVSFAANDQIVRNNHILNVLTTAVSPGDCAAGNYGAGGIMYNGTSTNIYIYGNDVHGSSALDSVNCTPIYDSPASGIGYCALTHADIRDNTVTGSFRDSITADSTDCNDENVDQYRNNVNGYKDDGNENKGWGINVRIWQNTDQVIQSAVPICAVGNCGTIGQPSNYGSTGVAVNNSSNDYGPVYVVRHNFYADMGGSFGGVTYIKASPNMPYFFEQNTFRSDWTGGNSDGDNVLGSLVDAHNNIIYTKAGNIWVSGGTGTITAVTFSGSATGITLGTYNDKKPTSGTNSCVQAFALGTYDQTFDITVGAGPAFTVVAIGFGGYGGCLLNDTLKIPGTVFMGGSTPGNDLTLTVQAVASFTSDNNLYYQTDGTDINNIGKTWDNTGSGGTPAINYSTITAFRTGTGGDTNTIDGMNPSFVNTANHISSASAAANAGVALDNLNCASASPQTCLWPFTTSNAAIGFWEPNQPVTGGTGADMLLLRVIQ